MWRIGRIVYLAVVLLVILAGTTAPPVASASALCRVRFKGQVTEVVNLDPRVQVSVGDDLVGSLRFDPSVVIGTVDPGPPGGPFDVSPISRLVLTVGTLSASLDPTRGGFIVPELLDSPVVSFGAFFVTPDALDLHGGNTVNAGGGSFVIGNSSDGGIIGTYELKHPLKQQKCRAE